MLETRVSKFFSFKVAWLFIFFYSLRVTIRWAVPSAVPEISRCRIHPRDRLLMALCWCEKCSSLIGWRLYEVGFLNYLHGKNRLPLFPLICLHFLFLWTLISCFVRRYHRLHVTCLRPLAKVFPANGSPRKISFLLIGASAKLTAIKRKNQALSRYIVPVSRSTILVFFFFSSSPSIKTYLL